MIIIIIIFSNKFKTFKFHYKNRIFFFIKPFFFVKFFNNVCKSIYIKLKETIFKVMSPINFYVQNYKYVKFYLWVKLFLIKHIKTCNKRHFNVKIEMLWIWIYWHWILCYKSYITMRIKSKWIWSSNDHLLVLLHNLIEIHVKNM